MSWKVDDVMTKHVIAVRPSAGFKELVTLMSEHGIGALPVVDVVDSNGRLVGMVSETDLLAKERAATLERATGPEARREQRRARALTAEDLMSAPVVTLRPGDTLSRAARLMHTSRIKHAPVVDRGRLVGIVSRGDLLRPYLRSDDSILDEVRDAVLGRTLHLAPETVRVSVEDGVVTLAGELPTSSVARLAVRLVDGVAGVVAVRDQLAHRLDTSPPDVPPLPGARGLPAAGWRR